MHSSIYRAVVVASALLVCSSRMFAAEEIEKDPRIPSAGTMTALASIDKAIKAQDLTGAETEANALLTASAKGSIDEAYANLLLAQIKSTDSKFSEAIPYLERALEINLFDADLTEQYTTGLADLYVVTKQEDKAMPLYKKLVEKAHPLASTLYAYTILLNKTDGGPKAPENAKEALIQAERLMRYDLKPKKEYYQLAASCAQAVGNYEKACAYLERLIEMEPNNEMFWNQLVAMHYTAGELVAAIVSIERAQEKGLMSSQKDNVTRVELYYNLELFPETAKIIEEGLSKKTLPNEQRFWEMLCLCYEQMLEPEKAMNVLERASATTTWSGIDTRLAERNYRAGKFDKVIINLNSALKKGGIERMGDFWTLMASAYMEQGKIEKAEECLANAAKYPEATSKVERLNRIIKQMKAAKEAEKAEAEEAAKAKAAAEAK